MLDKIDNTIPILPDVAAGSVLEMVVKMQYIKRDSWLTLILCLGAGLFIIIDTLTFPSVKGQGFGQGPGFYPQVLAWLLILFGVLVPIQNIRTGRAVSAAAKEAAPQSTGGGYGLVAMALVVCVLLTLAMEYCGFIVSGFVLTLVTVRLIRGGVRRTFWVKDIGFSAGIIALVYLMFQVFIGIQLPQSIFAG